jgi:hypothetical protein
MPGKQNAPQRQAARGSRTSANSSQAQGAQGWKQLNSPTGVSVATRSGGKGASATSKSGKKTAKASTPRPRRSQKPPSNQPPRPPTRDTAIINWILGWPRHIKQAFSAGLLLFFTVLLAVGLLIRAQSHNALAALGDAFDGLFGWGAYLLVIGLAAFALAHLAEAATRKSFIRLGLVIQLIILGCLLVLESRLLLGNDTGQLFGALLAGPISGLPPDAQEIGVVGAIVIVLLLIFHISFSQVIGVLRWCFRILRALAHALSGRLAAAIQRARARAAARKAAALAAAQAAEEEEDAGPEASGGSISRSFPRLPRRAGSGSLLVDDEGEDAEGNPAQPAPGARTSGAFAVPGRRSGQQATGTQPALPGKAGQVGDPALDDLPQLPPLPMKADALAKPPVRGSSGPLPAVGVTPTLAYELPSITLLNGVIEQRQLRQEDLIEELASRVERTLRSFQVDAEVRRSDISIGPTVIRIGIRPVEKIKRDYRGHVVVDDEGKPVTARTRVSRIMALQNDLALDLEAKSIRMEAPVPGRPYVGVEIPNKHSRLVTLREILASKEYEESRRKSKLTIALGRDVAGRARVSDLARCPHVLIAGATGAGKSVCINSIIACLLMQATPDDVRLVMIDPKMVELTGFNGIPHLLTPVVTEIDKVVGTLKSGVIEMERRYRLFSKLGVRNLEAYRKLRAQRPELEALPNIVIIIDELADLMMSAPEEIENLICRLAQLARATGIHLVVATQRPSVDVITGLIKANIPTRISFVVSSVVDSRTILDMGGAERLLGRGDMLYLPVDAGKPERIQGTFLADDELERIVEHWRQAPRIPTSAEPSWEAIKDDSKPLSPEDDLLAQAEQIIGEASRPSISLLQRRLGVGYARAARLYDMVQARRVVATADHSGRPRDNGLPEENAPGITSSRAGAGATGGQSATMPHGVFKGQTGPGTGSNRSLPLPPTGAHRSGKAPMLPDGRNSGTLDAGEGNEDMDEEVEESEW